MKIVLGGRGYGFCRLGSMVFDMAIFEVSLISCTCSLVSCSCLVVVLIIYPFLLHDSITKREQSPNELLKLVIVIIN